MKSMKNIKLKMVSVFCGLSSLLLYSSLQASEIQVENISRQTWDFQSAFESEGIAIVYFDKKIMSLNKWSTFTNIYDNWLFNKIFDPTPITDYALKMIYCQHPSILTAINYNYRTMIVNRYSDGSVEIIGIDDCSGNYLGNPSDWNNFEKILNDQLKGVNELGSYKN